jgi:hypothetical protein
MIQNTVYEGRKDMISGKFAVVLALPALVMALSCSNGDEEEISARERDLRLRVQNTIADLDQAIARAEKEIEMAGDSTKADLQNELEDLRKTRDELNDRLDEIGRTADDQWDSFRGSVDSLLTEASRSLRMNDRDTLQVERGSQ